MLAARATLPIGIRLSAGIFASAALLGMLKFSFSYPLPSWHAFFIMLGAVSALPLWAIAAFDPMARVVRDLHFAVIFIVIMAVLGIIIVAVAHRPLYADVLALLSSCIVIARGLYSRQWYKLSGGCVLFCAFLLFATKISVSFLKPGDILHLGMGLGLWLSSRRNID